MIRIVALAALAVLAGCAPDPYGYEDGGGVVYGGVTTGYDYGYRDRPYWGPSYQPAPAWRGQPGYGYREGGPHGEYRGGPSRGEYRGGPSRGEHHAGPPREAYRGPPQTPASRQFWGLDRADRGGATSRDPGGPRGAPGMLGAPGRGGREGPRVEQGAD